MGNGDQGEGLRAVLEAAVVPVAVPQFRRHEHHPGAESAAGDTDPGADVAELGGHRVAGQQFADAADADQPAAERAAAAVDAELSHADGDQQPAVPARPGADPGARDPVHQPAVHGREAHPAVPADVGLRAPERRHRAEERAGRLRDEERPAPLVIPEPDARERVRAQPQGGEDPVADARRAAAQGAPENPGQLARVERREREQRDGDLRRQPGPGGRRVEHGELQEPHELPRPRRRHERRETGERARRPARGAPD